MERAAWSRSHRQATASPPPHTRAPARRGRRGFPARARQSATLAERWRRRAALRVGVAFGGQTGGSRRRSRIRQGRRVFRLEPARLPFARTACRARRRRGGAPLAAEGRSISSPRRSRCNGRTICPARSIQIRPALRPDGLFLAALTGGETLTELRQSLFAAESEVRGGASPRVLPAADVRDLGALLQRAGFALPVVDRDT